MKKYLLLLTLLLLCACPKKVKEGVVVSLMDNRIYYEINKNVNVQNISIYEYVYNTELQKYKNGNPYDFAATAEIVDKKLRYRDKVWDDYHLPYITGNIYHVILECKNSPNYERYYKIIDKDKPEVVREINFDEVNNLKIEYVKKPKLE